jgi:hypothetical protein
MKNTIFAAALLVVVLTINFSQTASAHGWGCRHGYYRPAVVVRVAPPMPRVMYYPPVYGYYPRHYACGPVYRPRFYHRHEEYRRW